MDKLRIMIVEDQTMTAEVIRMVLEKAGHEIAGIATNYPDLISAIENVHPDVILMDIDLGDDKTDGIEIINRLSYDIPVIYLTGRTDLETFSRARETGPSAFLTKPFKNEDLLFQVQLAAGRKSTQARVLKDNFFVYSKDSYIKIVKKEVLFLEAKKVYSLIYLRQKEEPVVVTMNLGYLEHYFTESNFSRISHSVIINEDYLTEIKGNQLYFEGRAKPLEIPESKRADLKKKLPILRTPRGGK